MPRDNFQALFSNKTQHSNDEKPSITPLETVHTSVESTEQELSRSSLTSVVINGGINNSQRSYASASDNTKPGTESIAYLKRFVSPAIQNIRDLKLAEKMNALADNLDEYPERVRRDLEARRSRHESCTSEDEILFETWEGDRQLTKQQSDEDMAEDCERLRKQAEDACQQVAWSYDELMKFVEANPKGTYEEFIQSLLSNTNEDNKLLIEDDFYKKDSRYRNLWNDNLTLGLASDCTTLDGRLFVAARDINPTQPSDEHEHTSWARPSSGDMANPKRLASSAYNVLSNVSSLAMKPLRDLQLAEKVNAMQLDIEEEEARKEIERYHMREGEKRDLEEMMKLKKEAEERTLTLTMDHLMSFHEEHPGATYTEWIEDLHPENAHDGTLLEGFGKTIDHRFFVEESDHRRIWNENLTDSQFHVPARPRQMDDEGKLVTADDLLSGSENDKIIDTEDLGGDPEVSVCNKDTPNMTNADLITFD